MTGNERNKTTTISTDKTTLFLPPAETKKVLIEIGNGPDAGLDLKT